MKSLRRKTKRSQRRTLRRSPKRTSRRSPKRTSRRCPKRTSRRSRRRSQRRSMKGGMTREEINQYCATKQGLEKRLCEDLPKLLERHDDIDFDLGDLEFLLVKWKDYITENFETIKNKLEFDDDDTMNTLNDLLQNEGVTFEVISKAYKDELTGNWEPAEFGEIDDDEEYGPLQEWLNDLHEVNNNTLK